MSVVAPPEPPRPDELEALIREAKARQRKRWVGAASAIALLAGITVAISSIAGGTSRATSIGRSRSGSGTQHESRCSVRVDGVRILQGRHLVYREPVSRTFGHEIQCSGSTIWVIFFNGVASSQEAYFGVRSGDGGRSWRVAFAEEYFDVKAPHQLVTGYLGPWTLSGPRRAYFIGICIACGYGTVGLWATRDGGQTFQRYDVPALTGYGPTSISVSDHYVAIRARRGARKTGPLRKTVRVRVG